MTSLSTSQKLQNHWYQQLNLLRYLNMNHLNRKANLRAYKQHKRKWKVIKNQKTVNFIEVILVQIA